MCDNSSLTHAQKDVEEVVKRIPSTHMFCQCFPKVVSTARTVVSCPGIGDSQHRPKRDPVQYYAAAGTKRRTCRKWSSARSRSYAAHATKMSMWRVQREKRMTPRIKRDSNLAALIGPLTAAFRHGPLHTGRCRRNPPRAGQQLRQPSAWRGDHSAGSPRLAFYPTFASFVS